MFTSSLNWSKAVVADYSVQATSERRTDTSKRHCLCYGPYFRLALMDTSRGAFFLKMDLHQSKEFLTVRDAWVYYLSRTKRSRSFSLT